MNSSNLANSIVLLGPSSVGKSLLAENLSNRLNLKLLCLDDLFDVVRLEMNGYLDATPHKQQSYIENCLNELMLDEQFADCFDEPIYVEQEKQLVTRVVDLYNYYHKMLGDFTQFYNDIYFYDNQVCYCSNAVESIACLNNLVINSLAKVFMSVNQPMIIDPPPSLGWLASNHLTQSSHSKLMRAPFRFDACQTDESINWLIAKSQSVLLEPGKDYELRNSAKKSSENNYILNNLDNYADASVIVSTNALFNDPENEYLQQRTWFDAKEHIVKQQLKNKKEIDMLCNQIITNLEELKQVAHQ